MQTPIRTDSRLSRFNQGLADASHFMNPNSVMVKVSAVLHIIAAIVVKCLYSSPMTTLVAAILLLCGAFWLLFPEQIEQFQAELSLERLAP